MADWPFVGRTGEQAMVLDVLRQDPPAAVIVVGEAGVGKTRLAREAMAIRRAEGVSPVTVVASHAARSIPLGALAGLLPSALPSQTPFALLQAARHGLAERTGATPALLFVDDAHLLDDVSATLVHQVVTEQVCPALLTTRPKAGLPEALVSTWRGGWATRLDLAALDESATSSLLTSALGGPVDARTAHLFHDGSGGNALYLTELIRAAREAGVLVEEHGQWRLRGQLRAPQALLELVTLRLHQLAPHVREALDVVAISEHAGLAELEAQVSGPAIDALEAQELIVLERDRQRQVVRLAHPIYGEAVQSTLPARRARSIRLALADRLEATGARRNGDALRIALWRLDAGVAGDPATLSRAADDSATRLDWPLTERLARAAWSAGAGVPAGIRLAEASFKQGHPDEALGWFEKLLPLATDDDQRSRVIDGMAYVLSNQLGRYREAVAAIDKALTTLEDPATRGRLQSRLGMSHLFAGHPRLALETVRSLLSADDPSGFRAAYAATLALWTLGRYDEGLATSERGESWHRASGAEAHQPAEIHLISRGLLLACAGRIAEASQAAGMLVVSLHTRRRPSSARRRHWFAGTSALWPAAWARPCGTSARPLR